MQQLGSLLLISLVSLTASQLTSAACPAVHWHPHRGAFSSSAAVLLVRSLAIASSGYRPTLTSEAHLSRPFTCLPNDHACVTLATALCRLL